MPGSSVRMTTDGSKPRKPRLALATVAAVLLVVAGVAIGLWLRNGKAPDPQADTKFKDSVASQAASPLCSEVFVPGKAIELAAAGCRDVDGDLQQPTSFRCHDNRRLWQIDAGFGGPAGYGKDGEPYVAVADTAKDPGYAAAYTACTSG